jgi:hypothetical protein
MGRKGRWFDTVQRILSTSEPDPVETQTDAKVTMCIVFIPLLSIKVYCSGPISRTGISA